jgi:hypothetical protein
MRNRHATRLRAATASGSPALSVIDFSLGGILVEAEEPFEIGALIHLSLSGADGTSCGTFALRCRHAHRSSVSLETPVFVSALVFVHPLDKQTARLLTRLSEPPCSGPQPASRGGLRLARSRADFQF